MRHARVLRGIATALLGGAALVACSSDDSGNAGDNNDASIPAEAGVDAHVDSGSSSHSDAGLDATVDAQDASSQGETGGGQDDAGDAGVDSNSGDDSSTIDAGVDSGTDAGGDVEVPTDAGSDSAATGSPCGPANTVQSQACGLCGTQDRVCLANDDGDGGTSGPPVWQPWGYCQNEPRGACAPGTVTSEACGKCGTRQRVCQYNCQWAVGACGNEPPNACTPGATNYVIGLSCDAGGRSQTCSSACTWGPFGPCDTPNQGGAVTISAAVSGVVTSLQSLADSPTAARLTRTTCPTTVFSGNYAQTYVEVDNPTAHTATVSLWLSQAPGTPKIDLEIAAYAGTTVPSTDQARAQCINNVNDSCTSHIATACLAGYGGLVVDGINNQAVTIGPNGSILVYVAAVNAITSTVPHSGPFQLNVRTETLL